jgi:hypothetical protein
MSQQQMRISMSFSPWLSASHVCPAHVLERQWCTAGIGQMLRETGAHTPEGGGESWQDHVQA